MFTGFRLDNGKYRCSRHYCRTSVVIFFFPYNPPPPLPRQTPRPSHPESLISVHFGSVSALFGSVSGPFRVRFEVLDGVGERGFCKGKELGKTKTLQTVALRVAILSDFSARRLSQNFGAKLKQKSDQVRAVFSWKFAGTE